MLFGNHLLRELYKESKIRGRDAGLVLSHFLAVTNTTKLLSQNKTFLPLAKAHQAGRAGWPYIAGLAMSCSPLPLTPSGTVLPEPSQGHGELCPAFLLLSWGTQGCPSILKRTAQRHGQNHKRKQEVKHFTPRPELM